MFIRVNYLRKNIFYDIPVPDTSVSYQRGDFVILKTDFEEEPKTVLGKVVFTHDFEVIEKVAPTLLRKATHNDIVKLNDIKAEEKRTFVDFVKKIKEYKLDMQPVAVYFSFDGKFADFVFSAEERVDFRELVKDLVSTYKKKIFLEQVNARDRSQLLNGCGSCGRTLCCSTFLKDRPPVTMTAVRGQDLYYRDREKLTGVCGKLKCCLNYELGVYEELAKAFPKMKAKVALKDSGRKGIVIGRSILDQMVRVAFDRDEDGGRPELVPLNHITVLSK